MTGGELVEKYADVIESQVLRAGRIFRGILRSDHIMDLDDFRQAAILRILTAKNSTWSNAHRIEAVIALVCKRAIVEEARKMTGWRGGIRVGVVRSFSSFKEESTITDAMFSRAAFDDIESASEQGYQELQIAPEHEGGFTEQELIVVRGRLEGKELCDIALEIGRHVSTVQRILARASRKARLIAQGRKPRVSPRQRESIRENVS